MKVIAISAVVLLTLHASANVFGQSGPDASCKCGTQQISVVFDKSKVIATQSPIKADGIVQSQFGLRAPIGHTHTCVNGHTWDHSVTSGHNCPVCGAQQFVQDSVPRMVTTVRTGPQLQNIVQPAVAVQYSIQGGCANGQCPTATTSRGFFRK